MANDSWYRRGTWTQDEQAAFFARLKRSRGAFQKAQYCRIQAYELQQAGNFDAAIDLLKRLMAEWPDDFQEALVHHQMAQCLERIGDLPAAVDMYRSTFEDQRRFRGVRTNAHLDFGLFVATFPKPELFDEALAILDEFAGGAQFPIHEYQAALARALIWEAKCDGIQSARYAKAALAAASKTYSGFAKHPTLGLVKDIPEDIRLRIERLANS